MVNLLNCVGKKCKRGHEIRVLKSNAGYYVGTLDEDGCPNCRLSQYYGQTKDDPIMSEERDCIENQYCNGGQINGCTIHHSLNLKRGE